MSNRRDITSGIFSTTRKSGLVYTEILGWIDLGHAQGNDARSLKVQLEQEASSEYIEEFNQWYFPVSYHQEMTKKSHLFGTDLIFNTGVISRIMVKTCLTRELKARVALTIMCGTAKRFEAWQNSILFNWYTDSGFSAEDLVSDLIGFYRVFGSGPDPLWRAKPVPYETALQIWDAHGSIGGYKNAEFSPLLFSGRPPFRYGHPIRKPLPQWLNYIKPFGHEYNNFFLSEFRGRPRDDFFKESSSRINHELYGSVSTQSLKNYSDSPFERPVIFLLNPHYPQPRW
ncbi:MULTISPECIES: hypothetical protein [Enterobacterales]|uniref:hypothetical protein n=1 Tax=Enterobacterales TaxID=91347 RepID=UPI002EDAF93E